MRFGFAPILTLTALLSLHLTPARADPPSAPSATPPPRKAEVLSKAEQAEAPAELPPPSTRWKLVLGGLGLSAAWYGAAAGMSFAFPDAPGAHDLRVPFAGPWMALAHNCAPGDSCSGDALSIVRAILTALDGVGQAAGPLLVLEGILLPTEMGSRAEPRRPNTPPAPESQPKSPTSPGEENKNLFFVRPVPVGLSGVGLTISGRF